MTRVKIADFGVIQKSLDSAVVTFYVIAEDGSNSGTLATLYQAATGSASRENPQTLDENGMLADDCYVESGIMAAISGIGALQERSLKKIRQSPLEYHLPLTSSKFYQQAAEDLYVDLAAVSAAVVAAQLAETNAETAETNAETAEVNAELAETNAETAETNAVAARIAAEAAQAAAEAALAAAVVAQSAAELAETNAETAETNAETAEVNAETAETNAETAQAAAEAAQAVAESTIIGLQFTFDATTAMADPGAGDIRLNNAAVASTTAIAIDDLSSATGTPDVSAFILSWDDSTNTNKGILTIKKRGTPATFAVFAVTGLTDNAGWTELAVTYLAGNGTFSAADSLYLGFSPAGNVGSTGAAGSLTIANGAGTADAITADFTPDLTIADNLVIVVVSPGANTVTNPTLNTDGTGALTIKKGNAALVAGDTGPAGYRMLLCYEATGTYWELLNPYTEITAFAKTLLDDANAATARATLGLAIGTDVQAYDAELAALAGLTSAANTVPVFTGSGTSALVTFGASQLLGRGSAGNLTNITLSGLSMVGDVLTVAAGGGVVLQAVSMSIAEATGTTEIPFDDTPPGSTEGTEVGSQAIVLADNTNKVLITGNVQVSIDTIDRGVILGLFRGSTCIQSRVFIINDMWGSGTLGFAVLDSPATAGSVTYSLRAGRTSTTGTWAVSHDVFSGFDLGGSMNDGLTLMEISV